MITDPIEGKVWQDAYDKAFEAEYAAELERLRSDGIDDSELARRNANDYAKEVAFDATSEWRSNGRVDIE